MWLGHSGWALLDYLCVAADRRNGGLGVRDLEKLREAERGQCDLRREEIPLLRPGPGHGGAAAGLLCPQRRPDRRV